MFQRPPITAASSSSSTSSRRIEPRRLGEDLWRSAELQDALPCDFFPRRNYAALVLPQSPVAYVFGGAQGARLLNDVWRLEFGLGERAGSRRLSEHDDCQRSSLQALDVEQEENPVARKWSGRERFAAVLASVGRGKKPKLYVVGGRGPRSLCDDSWLSDDGGVSWCCTCKPAPWGGRMDASIAVVPGHPRRLLLCGGIAEGSYGAALLCDAWLSDDAGRHWHNLAVPPWGPRIAPLVKCRSNSDGGFQVVLFGGSRLRNGTDSRMRLSDCWVGCIDFEIREAVWRFQEGSDEDESYDKFGGWDAEGADQRCGVLQLERKRVLALQELGRLRSSSFAAAEAPPAAAADGKQWSSSDLLDSAGRLVQLPERLRHLEQLALNSGRQDVCPRLFFFLYNGVATTGLQELEAQLRILRHVGLSLASKRKMTVELWECRVMPALLPRIAGL